MASASPNHGEQTEGGDEFAHQLRAARAGVNGRSKQWLSEHEMGCRDSGKRSGNLGRQVRGNFRPGQRASRSTGEGDRGVQVRSRNRPERQNQRHQRSPGRNGIGQKSERDVPARQPLSHDAGTDHRRKQQGRSQSFRNSSLSQCHGMDAYARPPQHAGPQHSLGFSARMKALLNLPAICGAIKSTSKPWPARTCRASFMS